MIISISFVLFLTSSTITHASHYTGASYTYTCLGGSSDWYNEAIINNLSAPCNSSPIFSSAPTFVVLNGQAVCLDLG